MPTVSFAPLFNLTSNRIIVTDTTDYAGQSLTASQFHIKIYVNLATSTGNQVVYANTSGYDIQPGTSRLNINPIIIPLDSSGVALSGEYSIELKYYQTISSVDTLVADQTQVYTFNNPCVVMDLQATINCAASTILSTDATNYGLNVSTISRTHKVFPPPVLALSAYVNALVELTVTGIYTTTWTQEVISVVVYDNPDGSQTTMTFTGIREFTVVCDDEMCKILCCLNNLKSTYDRLVCKNPSAAMQMKEDRIDPILLDATMYMLSKDCGNATKAALYLAQVMDVSGCTTDCAGCSGQDGAPVFVTPSSSSVGNTYVVDSPDNSIAVSSTTVGSTTTYHVQVSAALQTLINNFYNTTVSTSTPSYLTVTPSGTNPKNYDVAFTGTVPTINRVHILLTVTYNSVAGTASMLPITIDWGDTKFADPSTYTWTFPLGNTANDWAIIRVQDFLTSSDRYIIHAQLIGMYGTGIHPTFFAICDLEVVYFDNASDDVYIRFVGKGGTPFAWKDVFGDYGAPVKIAFTLY